MKQTAQAEREEQEQRAATLHREFLRKQNEQQQEVNELRQQLESLKIKQPPPPPPQPD
jgi:GrpB-like predicted nucleotidyltransferase (UPF0157 family)